MSNYLVNKWITEQTFLKGLNTNNINKYKINKYKKCPKSLAIRKIQTKILLRSHLIRTSFIKINTNKQNSGESAKKGKLLNAVGKKVCRFQKNARDW